MKNTPFTGAQVLKAAYEQGKLNANQRAAYEQKKLKAQFFELYHRAQIANQASSTGAALYDLNAMPSFGLTNLDQNCKLPEDYIMIAVKGRIAVIAEDADGVITSAQIKAASFSNLISKLDNTQRIPDLIANSEFVLNLKGDDVSRFSAKNFFIDGNRKDYIESSIEDAVNLPDGMLVLSKGESALPKILLPENIALSTPANGAGSKQYIWETVYIGFRLV